MEMTTGELVSKFLVATVALQNILDYVPDDNDPWESFVSLRLIAQAGLEKIDNTPTAKAIRDSFEAPTVWGNDE